MEPEYKQTQPGYLSIGVASAATLYMFKKLMAGEPKVHYFALAALFGGIGVVFSSLTVEIRDGVLRSYFGPGLPAKEALLQDIESAEVVRNPWYYGWGIKYTPHGWLYNVSGFDAVEIRLKSGDRFRLGTDEPDRLREAILEAKRGA